MKPRDLRPQAKRALQQTRDPKQARALADWLAWAETLNPKDLAWASNLLRDHRTIERAVN